MIDRSCCVANKFASVLTINCIHSAGEAWRNLDDNEKKPFEKLAQKEQEKYEQALSDWRKVSITAE